ncbi:MAG: M48 family metalloprotease [Chloroflexota bacterium]
MGQPMPRAARLALVALTLALAATLWIWAAHALWTSYSDSAVPASVHLPHLDPGRFFSASFLSRSSSYERFLGIDGLLALVAQLVVLAVYARYGHRLMRESAAGRVGTGALLGMLGFAIVWLAEVPFGLAAVWWQRDHGISHQGYVEWLIGSFQELGPTFVFLTLALAIAMGLAGVFRRWWWVVAAPIFVALGLLFTFLSPYLIPGTKPLHNPRLTAEARRLERVEGVGATRLRVQDVHRFTTAPNAESAGFGASRTVILWDTLLDGRFSDAEVGVVLAHEIGHLAHDDALRGVAWSALFLIPAWALIALLTGSRGGLARPEAVPLAILILVALQLLATPLFNVVSRHVEAAADWAALNATREPAVQRAAMRKLATTSLSDPEPPGWAQLLYGTHPTTMQRLELVRAWEERERSR